MTELTFDDLYSEFHGDARKIEKAEMKGDYKEALYWAKHTQDWLDEIVKKLKASGAKK